MLTSSDAKFRCMWYMVVWAVMLMVVSQFFRLKDHIAFYVFAAAAMLLLPLVTSIYSTTSGRHGAGLLRVSYIFCDPVLACVTVLPVLILSRLPALVMDYTCVDPIIVQYNATVCSNATTAKAAAMLDSAASEMRLVFQESVRLKVVMIQVTLLAPALLTLAMGRRSRKMSFSTVLGIACYWLIVGVEAADLIGVEVITLATTRKYVVINTVAIVTIAMIITNSYAIVTLCSYICPADSRRSNRFDSLSRPLVGTAAVVFSEIPLFAARVQVLTNHEVVLPIGVPAIFYIWAIKDATFIAIAVCIVGFYAIVYRRGSAGASCGRLAFDNPDVFFFPEKRDAYIVRHQAAARKLAAESLKSDDGETRTAEPSTKKAKRVTFKFDLPHSWHNDYHHGRRDSHDSSSRRGNGSERDVESSDSSDSDRDEKCRAVTIALRRTDGASDKCKVQVAGQLPVVMEETAVQETVETASTSKSAAENELEQC